MTPPSENRNTWEAGEILEKAQHIFESTRTYLESTVAEAQVIENKTRYLLILTLSVSFGLVGFLTVTVGNESSPSFLLNLIWLGGLLLLILAFVSFVLIWNLLPQHKIHHPGSEFGSFIKEDAISKSLWEIIVMEIVAYQKRTNANTRLNEKRGIRLKQSTYAVLWSLAFALVGFLVLLMLEVFR